MGAPAQAAMYAQIKAALPADTPAGKACSIPAHTATVGTPPSTATKGVPVVDGESAQVACSVSGTGTFSFDATVVYGATSLSITAGSVVGGGTGTAIIELTDPEAPLASPTTQPCDVFADQDSLDVGPGRIWARFECPALANDAQPNLWCAADGIFVLENCDE